MILKPFRGTISPFLYPLLAIALLLIQPLAVWLAAPQAWPILVQDPYFWVSPTGALTQMGFLQIPEGRLAALLLVAFASSCAVAALSIRHSTRSGFGFGIALMTIVPGLQLPAVLLLSILPLRRDADDEALDREDEPEQASIHVLQGLLAGVAIIVFAVIVSAVTFGAYGYGLFLLTPLTVGLCTGYLANRGQDLGVGATNKIVLGAATLGGVALIALALEGLICLVIVSPLVAGAAVIGGQLGRAMARARNERETPVAAIAFLPLVFALEAAMPPAAAIDTNETIDIAAPPATVWRTLTAGAPIEIAPGLVGRAGFAYPLRGRLLGRGVGAERLGYFSTGIARERVTEWEAGRRLAFRVLSQPPTMEEMSPYRRVHAPHVSGYFETAGTSFDLAPLAGGGTRLTLRASHVLHIDPVPYWQPIARWAAAQNSRRVLADVKLKAERAT